MELQHLWASSGRGTGDFQRDSHPSPPLTLRFHQDFGNEKGFKARWREVALGDMPVTMVVALAEHLKAFASLDSSVIL